MHGSKLLGALACLVLIASSAGLASAQSGGGLNQPLPLPPCVHVTLRFSGDSGGGAGDPVVRETFPDGCGSPDINLDLNTGMFGSAGSLSLKLGGGGGGGIHDHGPHLNRLYSVGTPTTVTPLPLLVITALSALTGGHSTDAGSPLDGVPDPASAHPSLTVSVSFRVGWKPGSCEVASAEWAVIVSGQRLPSQIPAGLTDTLCALGGAGSLPSQLGPLAAQLSSQILSGVIPADPAAAPLLVPVLQALRALPLPAQLGSETSDAAPNLAPTFPPEEADPASSLSTLAASAAGDGLDVQGNAGALAAPLVGTIAAGGSASASTPVGALAASVGIGHAGATQGMGIGLTAAALLPSGWGVGGAALANAAAVPPERSLAPESMGGPPPSAAGRDAARLSASGIQAAAFSASLPSGTATILAAAGGLALLTLAALYQRLQRPAALEHPLRQALYAACVAQGGGTSGDLARAVGAGRKTCEYHLRYMVRLGLLRADACSPGTRYAPHAVPKPPHSLPLEAQVIGALTQHPGASTSVLAVSLGLPRARVDRCVKDLLLTGRLMNRVEHKQRGLFVAEPVLQESLAVPAESQPA